MRSRPRTARPYRLPASAFVWLALLLGGRWAGWAHAALGAHRACPEHPGEHVHGEARAAGASAESGPRFAPAAEERAEHEHCGVLAGLRPVFSAHGGPRASAALEPGDLAEVARERRAVMAGARLYLLAPKASPPVRS